jgi:plasmid stabilization system protein ParE|tara:strand:+ start:1065 stop:1361 length:297 start_codon:yes stop_codon:yes gene_type:complete
MQSGYKILWTDHALSELNKTIEYLEENWTDKELGNLSLELEHTVELISKTPEIFQASKRNTRRAIVAKYNSLYYRINDDSIEIISFFSNRQDPGKIKL